MDAFGSLVSPATPASKAASVGYDEPGVITVFGLWLPFDGAGKLRHEIEAAVEEAYTATNDALAKADQILRDLRG